jgi:GT2 family glycosyltransferase
VNHFPRVAVVILNWNGIEMLKKFLPSVCASIYPNIEIIVADNASEDGSQEWVEANIPAVRLLRGEQNLGFAKGYNSFLKEVEADYYVLLNSDVEVASGWIYPVIQLMEQDAKIACCQPKILSYSQRNYFEYAGASGGWIDSLGYPFSRGRVFDTIEVDEGQYEEAMPVFWASGAALFIRAKLFHNSGGFDEYFFAHQEEIDLCWRLQRMGYKIYVCPQSVVYHVGAGTLPAGSPRKVYLNFRNNLIMLVKNIPLSEIWWKIPVRIALDAISAWKQLFQGQPGYFGAVLKAHLSFWSWCLQHKALPKLPFVNCDGLYRGSVVWEYFIKGKKYFSQIVKRSSSTY